MLANDPRLIVKSEEYVDKLVKSVAVIKVSIWVKRAEFMSVHQDHGKKFKTFAYHVCSKTETCIFKKVSECECQKKKVTSYMEKSIKYVMLAGVGDDDIRREVLNTKDIFSSFDVISFTKARRWADVQWRTNIDY